MSNTRKLKSVGGGKGGMMNSPCTISETVQIARGVAEDAIADYHRNQGNVQLSMSIQIEILKDLVFSSGMITEEDFRAKYMEKAQELQKMQNERMSAAMNAENVSTDAEMKVEAGEVEIKVEE